MSQDRANRLRELASRIENLRNNIKAGKRKVTDEDFERVTQLENVVGKYEKILDKEEKMN